MRNEATYSASAEIARRAGVIETSYRVQENRFILSEKDLRSVRMSMKPEEYVTGLDVVIVSKEEARRLIAAGGYTIGTKGMVVVPEDATENTSEVTATESAATTEETAEVTEEATEDTTEEATEEESNE